MIARQALDSAAVDNRYVHTDALVGADANDRTHLRDNIVYQATLSIFLTVTMKSVISPHLILCYDD